MKYWEILEKGKKALDNAGIDSSDTDAFILFEYISVMSRAEYLLKRLEEAPKNLSTAFSDCIAKRAAGRPVQYITGHACFMGLDFFVNEHVLIPRFDTEILAEKVLSEIPGSGTVGILDMCTGSGCLAVSLAVLGRKEGRILNMTASDISEQAVSVAEKNARANKAPIRFVSGDLFENIEGTFDIIVSNPPYIRTSDIERLDREVKNHEPRMALDGDADGLLFYRRITEGSAEHINNKGLLFFEIGYDQGKDVECIMKNAGYKDIRIEKDLAGLDRVIWGRYC